MPIDLVTVPPDGLRPETIVDRRNDRSWTVEVRPFQIGTTVVTVAQWNALHGEVAPQATANRPKVEVTWREAITWCNTLSHSEGLTPAYAVTQRPPARPSAGWRPHHKPAPDDWQVEWDRAASGYRLPTEAEWQLACRAGSTKPRYAPLDDAGWYQGNTGDGPPPVGLKRPNAWGLFDTLGGVWEWCWDLFDEEVYGAYRIIRGGGWCDPHWSCRAGVRRKTHPQASFDDLGFRLARNVCR